MRLRWAVIFCLPAFMVVAGMISAQRAADDTLGLVWQDAMTAALNVLPDSGFIPAKWRGFRIEFSI